MQCFANWLRWRDLNICVRNDLNRPGNGPPRVLHSLLLVFTFVVSQARALLEQHVAQTCALLAVSLEDVGLHFGGHLD